MAPEPLPPISWLHEHKGSVALGRSLGLPSSFVFTRPEIWAFCTGRLQLCPSEAKAQEVSLEVLEGQAKLKIRGDPPKAFSDSWVAIFPDPCSS